MPKVVSCVAVAMLLFACKEGGSINEAPAPRPLAEPTATPTLPEAEHAKPEDEADRDPRNWTTPSAAGAALLKQKKNDPRGCRVTCTWNGAEVWSSDTCLGETGDFRFVSEDCERVVVIHPVARSEAGGWGSAKAAHVYKRSKLDYVVNVGAVVRDERQVRKSGSNVEWLAGTLKTAGTPPRYAKAGDAVEFETLGGQTQRIPLVAPEK